MSRRRFETWPAFVDLFIALFVAALGGFVLTAGLAGQIAEEIEKAKMVSEAERIGELIEAQISPDSMAQVTVSRPGDEVAIDLYFNFALDRAVLLPDDVIQVREMAAVIREALEALPARQRRLMQVVIEGHTDSIQPSGKDSRDTYLYNWTLSSQRALSVLYEFQASGLTADTYSLHAVGYADSRPLPECSDHNPSCDERNRRTTIRLRPDYVLIEQSLQGQIP